MNDPGSLARVNELLIMLVGQQHMRRPATLGHQHQVVLDGAPGPAKGMIDIATGQGGDCHRNRPRVANAPGAPAQLHHCRNGQATWRPRFSRQHACALPAALFEHGSLKACINHMSQTSDCAHQLLYLIIIL